MSGAIRVKLCDRAASVQPSVHDIFVPINSLRHAKKALINYQGKPRKGELVGNDSVRFCKFLGLEIRDGYAYMSSYQELEIYRGKGFNK